MKHTFDYEMRMYWSFLHCDKYSMAWSSLVSTVFFSYFLTTTYIYIYKYISFLHWMSISFLLEIFCHYTLQYIVWNDIKVTIIVINPDQNQSQQYQLYPRYHHLHHQCPVDQDLTPQCLTIYYPLQVNIVDRLITTVQIQQVTMMVHINELKQIKNTNPP